MLLSIITPIEEINFPKVLINLPQTEDAFYWQTPDDSLEFTGIKTAAVFNEKMMSAKTPEERKAHMAEHKQAMQGGMAMMNDISKIFIK